MPDLAIKSGASLQLLIAAAQDDGTPYDLAAIAITAQVRDIYDHLIAALVIVPTGEAGVAAILASTAGWPTGMLRLDFRITDPSGIVLLSDTQSLRVDPAVTRP